VSRLICFHQKNNIFVLDVSQLVCICNKHMYAKVILCKVLLKYFIPFSKKNFVRCIFHKINHISGNESFIVLFAVFW